RATAAALKNMVRFLLQNRQDEKKASSAERMTATSPPYINRARKIKVSETAMCDLNFGIWTVIREPTKIVRQNRTRKFRSITEKGSRTRAADTQMMPPAMTAVIYPSVLFLLNISGPFWASAISTCWEPVTIF